ncbi:MAG: hypothetical protein MHM6MM_003568 [Cercozoa sp. M6MM]
MSAEEQQEVEQFEIEDSSSDEEVDLDEVKAAAIKAAKEREARKEAKARSNIIFDIKPEGPDVDVEALAEAVKGIEMDGLTWAACEIKPFVFGMKMMQISCYIFDQKVSVDALEEAINNLEGCGSSEIAVFNKV